MLALARHNWLVVIQHDLLVLARLDGAERSSAIQHAILALVMPTHKRHFACGRLQLLISSTYRPAKVFGSDRLA
jgi:hypothetical protein